MAFLVLLHWCEGNRFRLIDCFSVLPVFPKFLWNWKLPLGSLIQLVPFLISLPTFYFLVCTFLWKKNEQCWPQHQSFEWIFIVLIVVACTWNLVMFTDTSYICVALAYSHLQNVKGEGRELFSSVLIHWNTYKHTCNHLHFPIEYWL